MQDRLKVLSVSGGEMPTEENGVIAWGNLICLGDFSETDMTTGRDIYKMKFNMPREEVKHFVSELKTNLRSLSPEKSFFEAPFNLAKRKSKTGEAVLVVTGFVTK